MAHCVEGVDWEVGVQSQLCAWGMITTTRYTCVRYVFLGFDDILCDTRRQPELHAVNASVKAETLL